MDLRLVARKAQGDFSLEVDLHLQGDAWGLFGPSGSGKSTLLSLLAGLQAPDEGHIALDGHVLFDSATRVNLPPERRRLGLVFQRPSLFPHLSVRGNLRYGLERRRDAEPAVDQAALVEALELGPLLERPVTTLSGGEQQRVAIGRAVLASPRLLLLDEPLSALDDALRFQIIDHLRELGAVTGVPSLFVSHSMLELRLLAQRVVPLTAGRAEAPTTPEALARARMGLSPVGYVNLLRLQGQRLVDDLCAYTWEGGELLLSRAHRDAPQGLFELSSKDIMLFKRNPEATSARNLLACQVVGTFESGAKLGVELAVGAGRLIAEIVPTAARDLGVAPGAPLFAAIKASAFRRLSLLEPA